MKVLDTSRHEKACKHDYTIKHIEAYNKAVGTQANFK